MTILLAKRNGNNPIATNDEIHDMLVADPEITQFPSSNSVYNQSNTPQQLNLTTAGDNAAQNADVLVKHDASSESWINKRWRPLMAYVYMVTCFVDFVIFPILWSVLQAISKGQVTSQWQPLTLQGAGLYHLAMGAIIGVAVYGRTKEKLEGKE